MTVAEAEKARRRRKKIIALAAEQRRIIRRLLLAGKFTKLLVMTSYVLSQWQDVEDLR